MALSMFLGRFYLGGTLDTFTIDDGGGAQTVTLTNGYRYVTGYTGEGTNQLCEDFTAKVQALGGNYHAATATFSTMTGKITLDFGGHNMAIVWTDGDLQTLMGFSGTQSGAANYVATNKARYTWIPSRAMTDYPTNATNIWNPVSTTVGLRSGNGTTTTLAGDLLNETQIDFTFLTEAETITPATGTVYADYQQFWTDVFHAGEMVRFYPDKTLAASTSFKTAVWGGEEVGSFRDMADRYTSKFNGLWNVTVPMWEQK